MLYDSSDCAVCFSLDTTQELKHPNIVQLYDYLVSVCDCHVTFMCSCDCHVNACRHLCACQVTTM